MSTLAGTGTLLRTALRRDRVVLPATVATFVVVVGSSAAATDGIFPTEASRVRAAETITTNPALVALYGRIYDVASLGAVSMIKLIGLGTAFVAVFTVLLVVRHTRADEEVGRTELAAAGVVGRYAALAAALALAALASLSLGLLTALSLLAGGLPAAGSFAFGAAWAGAGLAFAAVAGVTAQLSTSARTSRTLAMLVLAVAYVVRAAGDAGPESLRWLSWLSPIGWAQQVRPFAGDRWAVLPLPLLLAAALTFGACRLQARRDLGGGLLADRAGPDRAPRRLVSPVALAWRLDRGALVVWTSGFAVLGLVLGSIVSTAGDLLDDPATQDLFAKLGGAGAATDLFLSTELGFMALLASALGVSTVLRLHAEEASGRAEPVLSTDVSRRAWAGAQLLMAVLGTTAVTVAVGLGIGVAHSLSEGSGTPLLRDLGAALVRLPAVWVVVALTLALYGVSRRVVPYAWSALVLCVVVGEFGELMDLPRWTQDLSPYAHVPALPAATLTVGPLVALLAVAAVLAVAGLAAFERRDLAPD